jgi:hypothetical protein
MPVELIKQDAIPAKQQRHRPSVVERTKEWQQVMDYLHDGLPKKGALRIILSPETTKQLKHAPVMFRKMLQKRLKEMKLEYEVFVQGKEGEQPVLFYHALTPLSFLTIYAIVRKTSYNGDVMQTPSKISLAEFAQARMAWIRENALTLGNRQLCRTCNTSIELSKAYISLHESTFDDMCAGSGKVAILAIPFCPKCEPHPEERGCVHGSFTAFAVGVIFDRLSG